MTRGTGLSHFAERYPDRFWDVGIAEEHAVTMAAGMASAGMRPVVALYSTFLQRAFDEMLHDVCLQNLSVILLLIARDLSAEMVTRIRVFMILHTRSSFLISLSLLRPQRPI